MLSRIKRCCKRVFQSLIGANMANEKQGKFWREERREEKNACKRERKTRREKKNKIEKEKKKNVKP